MPDSTINRDTAYDPEEAWNELLCAIVGFPLQSKTYPPASFTPVLGPHLASHAAAEIDGVVDYQAVEKARCHHLTVDLLARAREEAEEVGTTKVCEYVEKLSSLGQSVSPKVRGVSEAGRIPAPELMLDFQHDIARLTVFLIQALGQQQVESPTPPDLEVALDWKKITVKHGGVANPEELGWIDLLTNAMRTGQRLDVWCEEAKKQEDAPAWVRELDMAAIRARILRLLAESVGSEGARTFWETKEPDYAELLEEIGAHALICDYGAATGFDHTCEGRSWAQITVHCGIGWQHVVWLEQLLRHTIVIQTRVHLAQSELAFALSLFDRTAVEAERYRYVIPPADPRLERSALYEVGLAWTGTEGALPESLAVVLGRCEQTDRRAEKVDHLFHTGLANLLAVQAEHAIACNRPSPTVALSLGFDRELERALARRMQPGGRFVLVLPVEEVGTQRGRDNGSGQSWLVCDCHCCEESPGYAVTRAGITVGDSMPGDIPLAGVPVVVKLAGAPLERIQDFKGVSPSWRQRIVLDEYDLFLRYVGKGSGLPRVLSEALEGSRMFFIGMENRNPTDRAHFYAIDANVAPPSDAKSRIAAGVDRDIGALALSRAHIFLVGRELSYSALIAKRGHELDDAWVADVYRALSDSTDIR